MKDLFEVSVKWDLLFVILSFIFFGTSIGFSFTGLYIPFIENMMRVCGTIGMACLFGYMIQVSAFIAACEENKDTAGFLKAFCTKIQQGVHVIAVLELALFMIGTFL